MSVSVSLEDTRGFSRESLIAIGGGILSGVVATGLDLIAGGVGAPQLSALAFGAIVGLAANLADHTNSTPMLRLILAIAGGVAMASLWPLSPIFGGAAAGLLLGGAFVLGENQSRLERSGFVAMYGFWMALAVFVTQTLSAAVNVDLIAHVFTGATWGLFLAFGGGLRRLEWRRDEILASFREAEVDLDGDLADTVLGGRLLYEQIVSELERVPTRDEERARSIARETSEALLALCRREQELEKAAERTSKRRLHVRVVELDERIEASEDPTVRRELEATLDELLEQVKVRQRLDVARVRLEARQQRCFTALERLHVSLIQAGNGGSADDAAVLESIASLEKLTDEIRWRNLSVDDLVEGDGQLAETERDSEELLEAIRRSVEVEDDASEDAQVVASTESEPDEAEEKDDEVYESRTVLDTTSLDDDFEGADGALGGDPPGTDGNLEAESVEHVEPIFFEHY